MKNTLKVLTAIVAAVISIASFVMTSYAQTTLFSGSVETAVTNTNVSISTYLDIHYNNPPSGTDSAGCGTTTTTSSFYARATALLYKNNAYFKSNADMHIGFASAAALFVGYTDGPYLTHFETTHTAYSTTNPNDRAFAVKTYISPNCDGSWSSTDNHILYIV